MFVIDEVEVLRYSKGCNLW